jgi:hypothetical protein
MRPQTLGGVVYLLVAALTVSGLLVVAFGPWRRGVSLIGVALLAGAAVRLLLGEDNAGMLRVRGRVFDVTAMTVVGIALIVLAANIPDQPAL